jgi:hypothetical protein
MMGQVGTTIMVAQTIAPRNGRRIQNDAAINPPMKSTASVVRVRSEEVDGITVFAMGFDFNRPAARSAPQE